MKLPVWYLELGNTPPSQTSSSLPAGSLNSTNAGHHFHCRVGANGPQGGRSCGQEPIFGVMKALMLPGSRDVSPLQASRRLPRAGTTPAWGERQQLPEEPNQAEGPTEQARLLHQMTAGEESRNWLRSLQRPSWRLKMIASAAPFLSFSYPFLN